MLSNTLRFDSVMIYSKHIFTLNFIPAIQSLRYCFLQGPDRFQIFPITQALQSPGKFKFLVELDNDCPPTSSFGFRTSSLSRLSRMLSRVVEVFFFLLCAWPKQTLRARMLANVSSCRI